MPEKEMAPQVGLEPTTLRLTAGCSAIELLRSGRDRWPSVADTKRVVSIKITRNEDCQKCHECQRSTIGTRNTFETRSTTPTCQHRAVRGPRSRVSAGIGHQTLETRSTTPNRQHRAVRGPRVRGGSGGCGA